MALGLYTRWPRCRFAGVFSISESEIEDPDRGPTDILSAFGLGRSADAAEKFVHQLRVIFSFQYIRRPGPARN
jgi:hypothetical protein